MVNNHEHDDIPLISIIVPIYNVAPWLRKCLDSLKNQTLKQIEIICVDDGSIDESGRIADEYVTGIDEYPIFRIYHTENRGLSAARNRGIDEARADWIMFVDSDDWVEPKFCELPWNAAYEYSAEIVAFDSVDEKKGKAIKKRYKSTIMPNGLVEKNTAHEYGSVSAWNKLYKKRLFTSIRYPEGRVYEDGATTHKLINEANGIVIIQDCLYHHLERKGSIVHTSTVSNKRDAYISIRERYDFLIAHGYPKDKIISSLCGAAIGFLSVTKPSDDELFISARDVVNSVNGVPKSLTAKQKMALLAWKINKMAFYFLAMFSGRLTIKNNNEID